MAVKCDKCGVQLSLPSSTCQACGYPISTTVYHPADDQTIDQIPFRLLDDPDSDRSETPGFVPTQDDAEKVKKLLSHIAGQSHFEERYIVRGQLASGGMGRIYRAFDQILRREVAIKTIQGQSNADANVRGQFLKEARVGGRLLHPNILAVFDLGVNRNGDIYYTMRLVDGADLQQCLVAVDRGVVTKLISYPLRRIIEAFVGACQGVDYAHQRGVIHLDIKPQNILVSGFNEVFVIDWGLARVDDTDDTEELVDLYRSGIANQNTASSTGVFGERVVGTPVYMSPEQARGTAARFDPTTDVYGLGGVLHFILYGVPPNRGDTIASILQFSSERKQRRKLRPDILPRGQRVSKEAIAALEALEVICLKALEPKQSDRYPSVDDMIVELKEWLSSTPGPPFGF